MTEALLAGLFGLVIGSFLNVCIHRWPRDLSVTWPGSRCPNCGHPIRWYDNVPVWSYFALNARCRHCLGAIHWRYPLVEGLTAGLFFLAAAKWGLTPIAGKLALFAAIQLGVIFADIETRLLPDQFTKGGILLGLAAAWIAPLPDSSLGWWMPALDPRLVSLVDCGLAAAISAGTLWLIGVAYSRLRHREGLGFGDVKLVAAMGAFLGISHTFGAVFLGCVAGTAIGLGYIWLSKKDLSTYELPFGSFLGAAAIVVAFWG